MPYSDILWNSSARSHSGIVTVLTRMYIVYNAHAGAGGSHDGTIVRVSFSIQMSFPYTIIQSYYRSI
ncbi:hypothetical protein AG1IA_07608 [Rhizoctonia solani AG-1 IA]|uniref:Uncharacterized protein n=1 Tax=Thanatephorus cucumeris (strain AG1-IA) TaxID=983506 RepID=L8WPU8_THACA|nr:hypothetical protein AG1IA_07608 [Rhizoctonia solani AG-1 IA]